MPTDDTSHPATSDLPESDARAELASLQTIIEALQGFDTEARRRIFDTVATFLQIYSSSPASTLEATAPDRVAPSRATPYPAFSSDSTLSPKDFLFEKQPRTDVERIAALAYYLAHFRDTPQFKTLDLSKLNTEAAQPKFSNAASSANNAVKRGYLVPTTKGQRQLSAAGERFVAALPDRDAARAAMAQGQPRRRQKRTPSRPTAATAN
jgi:hypothetical protein